MSSNASPRQIAGQLIDGKKTYFAGFEPRPCGSPSNFADKEQFVDVERMRWHMAMPISVVDSCKFKDLNLKARLLPHLSYRTLDGRLIHIRPSSGERPAPSIGCFAHQQKGAIVSKNRAPQGHFRRRVDRLFCKQRFDSVKLHIRVLCQNMSCQ